jgi:hypothetical protein
VSDHVKQGRVKVVRLLFVKVQLRLEAIPRILISIDFIEPERFPVKTVES